MKNQSMVIGTAGQSGVVAPTYLPSTGQAGHGWDVRTDVVRERSGTSGVRVLAASAAPMGSTVAFGVPTSDQPTTLGPSSSAPPIT